MFLILYQKSYHIILFCLHLNCPFYCFFLYLLWYRGGRKKEQTSESSGDDDADADFLHTMNMKKTKETTMFRSHHFHKVYILSI